MARNNKIKHKIYTTGQNCLTLKNKNHVILKIYIIINKLKNISFYIVYLLEIFKTCVLTFVKVTKV